MKIGLSQILTLTLLSALAPGASAQEREITNLSGDLYHFRNDAHVAVFLVTDDGVIATDPINEAAALWLEGEVQRRFDKEMLYVVYSHSDADHVSGGQVYADTAKVVAHENAWPIIREGDYTAVPDIVFKDELKMTIAGQPIVLHYFGRSHTDNLIVVEFPAERTIFVVDVFSNNRLPYRTMNRYYMPDAIEFLKRVEQMDFDVIVPGHGQPGDKAALVRHREYLEALYAAVQAAKSEGLSLAEAQATILLPEFSDLGRYEEWLAENIEGMYRIID